MFIITQNADYMLNAAHISDVSLVSDEYTDDTLLCCTCGGVGRTLGRFECDEEAAECMKQVLKLLELQSRSTGFYHIKECYESKEEVKHDEAV